MRPKPKSISALRVGLGEAAVTAAFACRPLRALAQLSVPEGAVSLQLARRSSSCRPCLGDCAFTLLQSCRGLEPSRLSEQNSRTGGTSLHMWQPD